MYFKSGRVDDDLTDFTFIKRQCGQPVNTPMVIINPVNPCNKHSDKTSLNLKNSKHSEHSEHSEHLEHTDKDIFLCDF